MAPAFKDKDSDSQREYVTDEQYLQDSPGVEIDHNYEKKLIRKIDGRLLPILGLLYSIALIDRVNISAARISGMGDDLGLEIGSRYTIALVVFFPPYFLFELPSNLVLRRVGSANWLSFIAFSWGCTMIGQVRSALYQRNNRIQC